MNHKEDRFAAAAKTLLAARPILRQKAQDWAEGFPASTDLTHTIGRSTGDSRVLTEAIPEAADKKPREGHGLADQCTTTADAIDQWIHDGYQLMTETLKLQALDHPVAEMLARHAQARFNGAGYCAACGDWIEGADYHPDRKGRRIDSGMCPTHAKQWRRTADTHHQSAVEWAAHEKERRRQLADNKTPECSVETPDAPVRCA